MPDKLRKAKLSVKQRRKVLALVAQGYNAPLICDYLKENYDIDISRRSVHANYVTNPRYKPYIERIRRLIDLNIAKHPLASKTNRLNIILDALQEAQATGH